jgi:hypothetical protein
MTFLATHDSAQIVDQAPRRRLAPGLGLTLGAAVSLALWAGLAYLAVRLLG